MQFGASSLLLPSSLPALAAMRWPSQETAIRVRVCSNREMDNILSPGMSIMT